MDSGEPPESAQQEREDELSLARIEAGDIPLSAERRLQELREHGGSFTSDLSVNGFALCAKLGLKPLSQVMGSSIYQVGYQGAAWPTMMGGSFLSELTTLSEAWNEVRRRALNRLELEARHAGPTRSWGCSCAPKATTGPKGRSSTRSSARRCDAAGPSATISRS